MGWDQRWDEVGQAFNRSWSSTFDSSGGTAAKLAAAGTVSLREQSLSSFPEYVWKHSAKIKTIDATGNQLVELEDKFGGFRVLNKVTLSRNQLTSIPASLCLATITVLTLDHNQITSLPESLGSMKKLRKLHLSHNPLRELPDSAGELSALQTLDLSHCQLASTPQRDVSGLAALGRCAALEDVNLSSNSISALPDAMGLMPRVRSINLDNNPLTAIPPAILKGCGCLQSLSMHGTGITPEGFEATEGYGEFELRRRGKHDKQIAGNVLLDDKGLDDGIDHKMANLTIPHT